MRLLVLGGTKFLGRALVDAALAAGHEVTMFNRGQTNPDLFGGDVDRRTGDRDGELAALEDGEWDAVVDTSGYVPRVVRTSAELLRERVATYAFVSSISVYADVAAGPTEGTRRETLDDPATEDVLANYGGLKAACEDVVQEVYGDRALVVRPGLIVGPHDPTDRFTYWPVRVARGGDVLAPAPPDQPVQVIDVRDLGEWLLRLAEARRSGAFNATGPERHTTLHDVLETCRAAGGRDAEVVWVDPQFLLAHDVGQWMEVPLWIADGDAAGMMRADVSRAVGAGLTFRPLEATVRDTLAWARADARELPLAAGLAPERERELLDLWRRAA